jgi:hypothetical protein
MPPFNLARSENSRSRSHEDDSVETLTAGFMNLNNSSSETIRGLQLDDNSMSELRGDYSTRDSSEEKHHREHRSHDPQSTHSDGSHRHHKHKHHHSRSNDPRIPTWRNRAMPSRSPLALARDPAFETWRPKKGDLEPTVNANEEAIQVQMKGAVLRALRDGQRAPSNEVNPIPKNLSLKDIYRYRKQFGMTVSE